MKNTSCTDLLPGDTGAEIVQGPCHWHGPPGLNGGHAPQHLAASPPPVGHNSGATAFNDIIQENLRRGIYRSQRDALIAVARDPRCTRSHILALAIVIGFMNSETGMAFPGWRAIAAKAGMFPGDIPDPGGVYSESTVNNLLSDLRRWGYLPSIKRGPDGGGRAIAHYTIARPSDEQLREEITKFIMESRALAEKARKRIDAIGSGRADLPTPQEVSDLLTPKEVNAASDLPRGREVSSDLPRGCAADLLRGRVTVTRTEELEENSTAASGEAAHATDPSGNQGQPAGDGARVKKKRNAPRTQIAPDWRPTDAMVGWVRAGWIATDRQITTEAAKFRDHHTSKGSLMADWFAAWRTWWLNGYHKIPLRPESKPDAGTDLDAAYEQLRREREGLQ